jgi:hypothetical protein
MDRVRSWTKGHRGDREARRTMKRVRTSPVIAISDYGERSRKLGRAVAARRRLDAREERRGRGRSGGRLWVNGRELGGTDPRHEHLALSFD